MHYLNFSLTDMRIIYSAPIDFGYTANSKRSRLIDFSYQNSQVPNSRRPHVPSEWRTYVTKTSLLIGSQRVFGIIVVNLHISTSNPR